MQDIFISYVAYMGIHMTNGWDTSTFSNIEVWTPSDKYGGYFFNNGIGIKLEHNDAFHMNNVLVYAASIGFLFNSDSGGSAWGSLSNCTGDFCRVSMQVRGDSKLTITGGSFWSHYYGLDVDSGSARVNVSGCDFVSQGSECVRIANNSYFTITSCNLERLNSSFTAPAINITGGTKSVVTGNHITAQTQGIVIGSGVNLLVITQNIVDIGVGTPIVNNAPASPFRIITDNVCH